VSALVLVPAVYEQPCTLRQIRGDYAGCLEEASLKKTLESLGSLGSAAAMMVATGTVAAERLEQWTGPPKACLTAAAGSLTASEWVCHTLACWSKVVVLQKRWAPGGMAGLH